MRIISSDGKIDIQYEQAVVWLDYVDEKHCYIKAMTQQKEYCMAHYTNYENAEKAMQMLHDAYTGILFARNIDLPINFDKNFKAMCSRGYGVIATHDNSDCRAEFYPLNICFQFPKDEEVKSELQERLENFYDKPIDEIQVERSEELFE